MSRKYPHEAESIGQILERVYFPGFGSVKKLVSENRNNKTELIGNTIKKPVIKSKNRFGRFNNDKKQF